MPQVVVPSPCFLRKGHLKSISQQAPQRLQSPRRRLRASTTSSFLKRMRTKRRSLPCACPPPHAAAAAGAAAFAVAAPQAQGLDDLVLLEADADEAAELAVRLPRAELGVRDGLGA